MSWCFCCCSCCWWRQPKGVLTREEAEQICSLIQQGGLESPHAKLRTPALLDAGLGQGDSKMKHKLGCILYLQKSKNCTYLVGLTMSG